MDHEFAYRINKIEEEEQRVGKVGRNKVNKETAQKQQNAVDKKREALKVEMRERYGGQSKLDQRWAEDKYSELAGKPIDYINEYKKSKKFRNESAEREVLNQLKEEWNKQPKFVRNMDKATENKRQQIVDQKLKNGYEWQSTEYNDRFVNKQT